MVRRQLKSILKKKTNHHINQEVAKTKANQKTIKIKSPTITYIRTSQKSQ